LDDITGEENVNTAMVIEKDCLFGRFETGRNGLIHTIEFDMGTSESYKTTVAKTELLGKAALWAKSLSSLVFFPILLQWISPRSGRGSAGDAQICPENVGKVTDSPGFV
jgi:hypothetical protein